MSQGLGKKNGRRSRKQIGLESNWRRWLQIIGPSMNQRPSRQSPVSTNFKGGMCPFNLANEHPAAERLHEYATKGCPVKSGRHWSREEVAAAVERGPHATAMEESAMAQFHAEALDKEKRGLIKIMGWKELAALPENEFPKALKVSPISAVPHKSRPFPCACKKGKYLLSTKIWKRRHPVRPLTSSVIRFNALFMR